MEKVETIGRPRNVWTVGEWVVSDREDSGERVLLLGEEPSRTVGPSKYWTTRWSANSHSYPLVHHPSVGYIGCHSCLKCYSLLLYTPSPRHCFLLCRWQWQQHFPYQRQENETAHYPAIETRTVGQQEYWTGAPWQRDVLLQKQNKANARKERPLQRKMPVIRHSHPPWTVFPHPDITHLQSTRVPPTRPSGETQVSIH